MPKDRKTNYRGVYARHQANCEIEDDGRRCTCKPSYYGMAYDRATKRKLRTRRYDKVTVADRARRDLLARLERGETLASGGLRLTEARERFITAAREGRALNKRGQRYKPSAIDNIEISLRTHVEPKLGRRRLTDIRRGDIQAIVDQLAPARSGSRVRNVVNSIRALYRWARHRDLASHDPAQDVELPAMNPTPIERVATPDEFERLLGRLELVDQVAYALAGYAAGRAAQIQRLRWGDVDLKVGAVEWGVEWEAAKYEASHRVVPAIGPLHRRLRELYVAQGQPADSALVIPRRHRGKREFFSTSGLSKRARRRWEVKPKLAPITLQECRHTCATWLDAAGISPRVASKWMGHQVPRRQEDAAVVTLARYTHVLPQDMERARGQLADYIGAGTPGLRSAR